MIDTESPVLPLEVQDDDWLLDDFLQGEAPPRCWPPPPAEELIAEVVSTIVERFQPLRIILFGSRARGDHRPLSDFDLLVVLPSVIDARATAVAIASTLCAMPLGKDIFVTTPDEIRGEQQYAGSVIDNALREGIVLYDRRDPSTQDP